MESLLQEGTLVDVKATLPSMLIFATQLEGLHGHETFSRVQACEETRGVGRQAHQALVAMWDGGAEDHPK